MDSEETDLVNAERKLREDVARAGGGRAGEVAHGPLTLDTLKRLAKVAEQNRRAVPMEPRDVRGNRLVNRNVKFPNAEELQHLTVALAGKTDPTTKQITNAIKRLVKAGKMRAEVVEGAKVAAVQISDMVERRDAPTTPLEAAVGFNERYIVGGGDAAEPGRESELAKVARTSKLKERTSGIDPGPDLLSQPRVANLLATALRGKEAKKAARKTMKAQEKAGTRLFAPDKTEDRRKRPPTISEAVAGLGRGVDEPAAKEPGGKYTGKGSRGVPKLVDRQGERKGPVTRSGKPIGWQFDDSGKPMGMSERKYRELNVVEGVPFDLTMFAKLNAIVRKGGPDADGAARVLAKLKTQQFGLKKSFEAGETRNPKKPEKKPVFKTAEQKAQQKARYESKDLGRTSSEDALLLARQGRVDPGAFIEGSRVSIPRAAEQKFRKKFAEEAGLPKGSIAHGPFTPQQLDELRKLAGERRVIAKFSTPNAREETLAQGMNASSSVRSSEPEPEEPPVRLAPRMQGEGPVNITGESITPGVPIRGRRARSLPTQFDQPAMGPRTRTRAMKLLREKFAKTLAGKTPQPQTEQEAPTVSSRKLRYGSNEVSRSGRLTADAGAVRGSETESGSKRIRNINDVIDRLRRIAGVRGGVANPVEMGPELPPVRTKVEFGPGGAQVVPLPDKFALLRRTGRTAEDLARYLGKAVASKPRVTEVVGLPRINLGKATRKRVESR